MLEVKAGDTDIGTRLDFVDKLYHKVNANVLIIAYRGYSSSDGVPSEAGIKLDGHATMEFIRSREDVIDTNNIFVMGRSLGGAVAVNTLATKDYNVRGKRI